MESFESLLPADQRLDTIIHEDQATVYGLLDEYKAQTGDIIDVDQELNRNIEALGKVSDILGQRLAREPSDPNDIAAASQAIYRSVCFAAQIADDSLPKYYQCQLLGYMEERLSASDGDSLDLLLDDTHTYLGNRPAVDHLLGYYMTDIDRSGRYGHLAELFAGLVFMLSERSLGERYSVDQIADLQPDDFNQPNL